MNDAYLYIKVILALKLTVLVMNLGTLIITFLLVLLNFTLVPPQNKLPSINAMLE